MENVIQNEWKQGGGGEGPGGGPVPDRKSINNCSPICLPLHQTQTALLSRLLGTNPKGDGPRLRPTVTLKPYKQIQRCNQSCQYTPKPHTVFLFSYHPKIECSAAICLEANFLEGCRYSLFLKISFFSKL